MFDFIVIGGGIAGISASAELAELGSVMLLEAEDMPGYHASGRSAAMFLETYGNQTVRALNAASADLHRDTGVLSPRGLLLVARQEQAEIFERTVLSFEAEPVTGAEAQQLWPILDTGTCAFAAHRPDVFDLDTDRLLQHFLRRARHRGAETRFSAPVTAVRHTGTGWCVTAGGVEIEGRIIVNAAGAWADEVAGLAGVRPLGIVPLRRSMARLPAPGGLDTRNWPFVDEIEEAWYAKPDAGALLVSPADEDPVPPQDAWADDMTIAEGLARYQEFVTEEVTRVETTWAGLRSFAPDRTLVIGRDATAPDFLWCAGQGGYGFQTAPAAARLLADIAAGHPSELAHDVVAALRPDRFGHA